jgi:hypothetical protein
VEVKPKRISSQYSNIQEALFKPGVLDRKNSSSNKVLNLKVVWGIRQVLFNDPIPAVAESVTMFYSVNYYFFAKILYWRWLQDFQ